MYGYLLSKNHDSSNVKRQAGEEDTVLSQYDEMLPVDAFSKNAEEVKLQNDRNVMEEKLKLEAAVEREEKANQMKRDRMKQDLEDFKAMDHLPDTPNNNIIAYQDSKPDRPKPADTLDSRRRQHRRRTGVGLIKDNPPSEERPGKLNDGPLKYGHNESISQSLSLRRVLPDVRDTLCQKIRYQENLPDVSVIIVFYNEAWTTLLRTIHSVVDRSPPQLIREIILIDDFSDHENLQLQLRDYLALLPNVVLKRTTGRVGVIVGRQIGASMAVGSVLVFLDAHCECTTGWLEPLLDRIRQDETHVVTPVMDIIDDQTFEFRSFDTKSINIGGFDWNLQFIWIGVPDRIQKLRTSEIDFVRSPTMPGGMFAISRNYFKKLGGYDTGMDMWGGENLEMSFKIWMCGGTLETVPCSHVGHLFRRGVSYKLGEGDSRKNFYRLAEVWLDEFKELYYQKINKAVEISEDIVNRKNLRKQLNCESFGWYLKNVYPELFIPSDAVASGEIRNKQEAFADGVRFPGCLDGNTGSGVTGIRIWPCHNQGGNQLWMLSKSGEIRRDEGCMDYSGDKVVVLPCHGQRGNQEWEYLVNGLIKHSNSKLCMGLSSDGGALAMSKCLGKNDQIWYWKRLHTEGLSDSENKQPVQELALDNY